MKHRAIGAAALLLAAIAATATTAAPRVATDIAPVQSIAARVMAGVGTPELVIPPGASPHGYALRPSEARALQEADLVVWVGPALTPWLADPIASLSAPTAVRLTLEDVPGVHLLAARSGAGFEPDDDEAEAHAAAASADADATAHAHDATNGIDGHLWLAPANAVAAARAIATALSGLDPANAATYTANAEAFAADLDTLSTAIATEVAPLRGTRYLVFHDAFHYFEDAFAIPAAGSVVLQDGVEPSAARVADLRARLRDQAVACVFTEPQFEPRLLGTVTEGTEARTGILDPLGAALQPGPDLYPAILRGIADGLRDCLAIQ